MFGLKQREKVQTIREYRVIEYGQYPICKVNNELATILPDTTITQNAFRISSEGLSVLMHRERLFKTRDDYNFWFTDKQVRELQGAGFEWFVLRDFIKKFEYHASLRTWYGCGSPVNSHSQGGSRVYYNGDIPSFALDRIEASQKVKLSLFRNIYDQTRWEGINYLTIHSNQPLPVKLVISDPVVIGWSFDPDIWLRDERLSDDGLGGSWSDIMGVVVAAWDLEGELR